MRVEWNGDSIVNGVMKLENGSGVPYSRISSWCSCRPDLSLNVRDLTVHAFIIVQAQDYLAHAKICGA